MTRSPLVLTLAFIFGVALAPAAAAQAPAAGTVFTGGSIGTGSPKNVDPGSSDIGVRVLSRSRVRVRAVSYNRCRGGKTTESTGERTGRLNADGSFRVSLKPRTQIEGTGFRSKSVVTGKLAGDQATGTIKSSSRGAGARGCRGSVDWIARTARRLGSDPAPVPAGAALIGGTSGVRGGPFGFNLRVSADGKRVLKTLTSFRNRCRKHKAYEETNIGPSIAIKPDGTFTKTERFKVRFSDATDNVKLVIKGRFVAGGATGTLRATTVSRSKRSRSLNDRCTTGTVRWSATPL